MYGIKLSFLLAEHSPLKRLQALGGMAVYSGTCTTLTLLQCDDYSRPGAMSLMTLTAQTRGAALFVRVWEYGNNNNGTFSICASQPVGAPANDDPCNATPISVNTSCSFTATTYEIPDITYCYYCSVVALAQSTSPEIERAYYEVNVNGESAFCTDIHCSSMLFSKTQYLTLKENVMQKEGVFNVTYLDNGKTNRFAHLSFVEAETLKAFGNSLCNGIQIDPRSAYSF